MRAAACALAASSALASGPGLHLRVVHLSVDEQLAEIELDVDLAPHERLRDIVAGGSPVEYILEMRIREDRFFADDILAHYFWKAEVRRGGLGESIQYRSFGSNDWREAADFDSALGEMREMRIEFDDVSMLRDIRGNSDTYISFRVEVVIDDLPPPLQVDLLTSSDWAFSSGWQDVRP